MKYDWLYLPFCGVVNMWGNVHAKDDDDDDGGGGGVNGIWSKWDEMGKVR